MGSVLAAPIRSISAWYVAFQDSKCPVWWHHPLKKGFRHCFAFGWDDRADRWIVMDPLFDTVYLRCMSDSEVEAMMGIVLEAGGSIIYAKVQHEVKLRPRFLLTCVTAVESLLGLSGCALTPYRLYRHLMDRGAIRIGG